MSTANPRPRWPYGLTVALHLGLLLAVLAWWVMAVIQDGTWETSADANIGAGLGLLGMATLGLPWSILMFQDPQYYGLSEVAVMSILTLCALMNVVLHALLMVQLRRRKKRDRAATPAHN